MEGNVIVGCVIDVDPGIELHSSLVKDDKCISLKSTKLLVRKQDNIKTVMSLEFSYLVEFKNETSYTHPANLNKALDLIYKSKPFNFSGASYSRTTGRVKEYIYTKNGILSKDIVKNEDNQISTIGV